MTKETYFYTTNTPHQWSSGPTIHIYNEDTWTPIQSLEEAKALAEKNRIGGYSESRTDTQYGVMYADE